jgi:hypothetical protein
MWDKAHHFMWMIECPARFAIPLSFGAERALEQAGQLRSIPEYQKPHGPENVHGSKEQGSK